jgi:hypothetical protein
VSGEIKSRAARGIREVRELSDCDKRMIKKTEKGIIMLG